MNLQETDAVVDGRRLWRCLRPSLTILAGLSSKIGKLIRLKRFTSNTSLTLYAVREKQGGGGVLFKAVCVHMCLQKHFSGMTNLAASASLLSSLA